MLSSATAAAALSTPLYSPDASAVLAAVLVEDDRLVGVESLPAQRNSLGERVLLWTLPTAVGRLQVWRWPLSDGGRVEVRSLERNGVLRSSVTLAGVPVVMVAATVASLVAAEGERV